MNYVGELRNLKGKRYITFEVDADVDIGELSRFSDDTSIKAEITFDDNRKLSADQRKKAWALMNEIARWSGYNPVDVEGWMKAYFMADTGEDYFSLSNCSVTTARRFIRYLIDFCFKWNVPFKTRGIELADDVSAYLYLCLKHRKCAICGQHADIHHTDAVGSGRDRTHIDHSKHRLLALCRRHHNEAHKIGQLSFNRKYKVAGIKLSERDIKRFRIGQGVKS